MTSDIKKNGVDNFAFETNGDIELGNEHGNGKPPEEAERAQWGNGIEFLMSCIAMSVGLGNIWRFPFTAYENGGGAFLIPYLIILTVVGRPLYYMEMTLGQFSSRGNVKMYSGLSPVFKCIGYGQLLSSICVATYYCCLMAITLFYFVNSFTSELPWATCQNEWIPYLAKINRTCIGAEEKSGSQLNTISSSEMWFKREVLHETDDIGAGIGVPEWRLSLCLLASWVMMYFVSIKGVQSSGKASYFLALFPYVIMITLLIKAATLDGAADGMYFFIKFDWGKLMDAKVWYAAITQCFFSLNVGFGSIIMYSSYNNFDHNINRDALVVTSLDTCTSLLSGVTIFGILGNLAYNIGVTPDKVINSGGTGLAFISYPDAISKFESVPWLFALLFFLMLFVLGMGSLVAIAGSCNTVLKDAFPNIEMWKIALFTALVGFFTGLVYVTPGGQYILDLVDFFGGTFLTYVFAIFEVVAVMWIYGLDNFCEDLEFMTKKKVGLYWRITWGFITPVILIVVFFYFIFTLKPLQYGIYQYYYPEGITAAGWCILGLGILQAICWISYYAYHARKTSKNGFWSNFFSHDKWRPKRQDRYEEWKKFKEESQSRKPVGRSFMQKYIDALLGRQFT
ncbi:unnamed protein product [Brassicogethes aeneus]|uniref:Transporter n=1 Tax=Brassicogethes aeneus TaxID=1431903 RepID=A0A9P0BJZ7_BRAAE|nr:unnamed protein product [Brassicogethes aeneus]